MDKTSASNRYCSLEGGYSWEEDTGILILQIDHEQ